jgi:hypothetical protein
MTIEIEPHPNLIEYFNITSTFKSNLTVDDFTNCGENYNICSNINQNIYLLKQLSELNLLKKINRVNKDLLSKTKVLKDYNDERFSKRDLQYDQILQDRRDYERAKH